MASEEMKKIIKGCMDSIDNRCNLAGQNLSGKDISRSNLCGADLSEANLYEANLSNSDLINANLYGANLRRANLYGANLSKANLYGANLSKANLCGANLYGADFSKANLCEANLHGANLCGAILYGADLHGANLSSAINIPFIPYICPETGSFIGFKKAYGIASHEAIGPDKIVVLEILEDAKRLSSTGRKCRCDKAKVLEIQEIDGAKSNVDEVVSYHDCSFIYKVGEIVSVPDFDEDRWNECSRGIHFFINRQEAVNYML